LLPADASPAIPRDRFRKNKRRGTNRWVASPADLLTALGFRRTQPRTWNDARLLRAAASLLQASRRSSPDVVDALAQTIDAEGCGADALAVFEVDGDELRCAHVRGRRVQHFAGWRVRRDDAFVLAARSATTKQRAIWPRDGRAMLPTDRCAVAVPWMDGSALHAVAYASSPYPNVDMPALSSAIALAGAVYLVAREREADRREADVDELTGLLTARAFRRRLHDEIRRASSRHPRPAMCLWFVDADGFKDVNDRLGHRAGDAVLQTMASLLRAQAVAGLDVAARNGGDEFCLLARATGKSRAIERARALCDAVNRHAFALAGVTASIGVAAYPHDAATPAELLDAADRAMYYSKRTGRNRVSYPLDAGRWASIAPEAATADPRTSRQWEERSGESFSGRSSR
jgi:diguanylate cyclase (GGDEF)-like protein